MGLVIQTATLVAGIVSFSCLPMIFGGVKKFSQVFFLTGTGAMVGLCLFDLLPHAFEHGGFMSIGIIASVFLLYALLHGRSHSHGLEQPIMILFGSLLVHCFSSGMFLVLSGEFSGEASQAVFMALLVHKSYEALIFSFILIERKISQMKKIIFLSCYALCFPLGVAFTWFFEASLNEYVAMVLSNVAVGSLVGCLIYDFLVPSIKKIQTRRIEIAFIALGFVVTQLVIRGV